LFVQIVAEKFPAVFIIMAVDAKVFPIGTVRRVVIMVSVFMMYCQEVSVFVVKLPGTLGADEAVDLQRAFPVITGGYNIVP
jgi:hypothetical protein